MDLYFLKGYKEFAATSLADLQALAAAVADQTNAANQATIDRVLDQIDSIVLEDSAVPLNLYFYDSASTVSSWATDAAVTLTAALGTPDVGADYNLTSTSTFTVASPRVGALALDGAALRNALANSVAFNWQVWPGQTYPGAGNLTGMFFLHVRKTTAGKTETLGLLPLTVQAGVLTA